MPVLPLPTPGSAARVGIPLLDLLLACSMAAADGPMAPLQVESLSPALAGHLRLRPRAAATLPDGRWEAALHGAWTNYWSNEAERWQIDYESARLGMSLAFGLGGRHEFECGLDAEMALDARLDGLIQGFHRMAGVDQYGRDQVPHGRTVLAVAAAGDRSPLLVEEAGLRNRRWNARCGWTLSWCGQEGARPALASTLAAGLPLAPVRSGDAQAALQAGWEAGAATLNLGGALTWLGSPSWPAAQRPWMAAGLAGAGWRLNPRWALEAQLLVGHGAGQDRCFAQTTWELALGARWRPWRGGTLELALVENLITYDNSADLGFIGGLRQGW